MKKTLIWLIPVILIGAGAAFYFWPNNQQSQPQTVSTPAAPAVEPAIRYPVESFESPEEPLPLLAESDENLRDALAALFGHKLPPFIYPDHLIQRIVATVDNLPRDYVASKMMPAKPVSGLLITANAGENLALSPKNAERYGGYVRLAEAVPTDAAIALYARFYPLFQEQYEKLGYPDKYFNDRLVEVIDHLLATPEIDGPLRLIQPKVLYQFADPNLEKLSAGQKMLLRIGYANEVKVKKKLREIRRSLVSLKSQ